MLCKRPFSPLDSEHFTILDNKLEFVNVDLNSEGIYQCGAENRHGMIVSATWVHVLGK